MELEMSKEMSKEPDVGTSRILSVMTSREVGRSGSPSESSIFRVHRRLREVNEKAYEPDIVSIGPYHRGKPGLEMMEVQKPLYLQLFLEQRNESEEKYIDALKPLEKEVRKCYAEYISLDSNEFVKMMLLDGFFIIEVILRFGGETMTAPNNPKTAPGNDPKTDPRNDLIFKMQWMINTLQRDLILFENQLPLVVLFNILDTVSSGITHRSFFEKALIFFDGLSPSASSTQFSNVTNYFDHENNPLEVWHLLELVHKSWFTLLARRRDHDSELVQEGKSHGFIPGTTALQEAGVMLRKAGHASSLFDIKFGGGVMEVPSLTVEDRTETFFRNLIAYEQYRPGNEPSPFTDYVRFLDCLIDTPKDVQTLSRLKIIDNWLGDDEVVSTMFNKIGEAVAVPRNSFLYGRVIAGVNYHCSRRRNRWMAMLKRDYFNSPWALISVLAALLLLVLTFIQAVFAVFPRK